MRAEPIDIEAALAERLGCTTYPLPPAFATPMVLAVSNGGSKPSPVTDRFAVALHCYGSTPGEAMDACRAAVADSLALEGGVIGGVACHAVEVGANPYQNPDPLRPDLSRVTAQIYFTCKSIV